MPLKDYFPVVEHPYKKEFDALLDTLYYHRSLISYIAHIHSGRYYHVSPSFESLTGYRAAELETQGVNFFLTRVPGEDTLAIMKRQAESFDEVHQEGYDPSKAHIYEMHLHLRRPEGGYIYLSAQGTPMAYQPTGAFDFVLVVARIINSDGSAGAASGETVEFLRHAKKLYWMIYPQPALNLKNPELTEIVIDRNRRELTQKEKEVLSRIAKGKSTKEIAVQLSISENTVETHRRNLLGKFEAKNVAELVKKASKQFWLE